MNIPDRMKTKATPIFEASACRSFRLQCQESLENPHHALSDVISLSPHARVCKDCMLFAEQLLVLHEEVSSAQTPKYPEPPEDLADQIVARLHRNVTPQPLVGILLAIVSCFGFILACILAVHWLWPAIDSSHVGTVVSQINAQISDWVTPIWDALSNYLRIPLTIAQELRPWTDQTNERLLLVFIPLLTLPWILRPIRLKFRNSKSISH